MNQRGWSLTAVFGRKRRLIAVIGLVFALSAALVLIGSAEGGQQTDSIVMTVNGRKVSSDEFGMYLDFNKAGIVDYFTQAYHAEYSEQFWTTAYGGETPLQKLREEAMLQLLSTIIDQQLALKHGVISGDIGYQSFVDGMAAENSRRSIAAADNEVVYGPISLDLPAYYSYYMANLHNRTVEAMLQSGAIAVTEEQLARDYEQNKQAKYTLPGDIRLEWASLPYGEGTPYKDASEAYVVMSRLEQAALEGANFTTKAGELGISVADISITNASRRTAALENPALLAQAEQMTEGEVSAGIDENGALHLLHCVAIAEPIIIPYEQAKEASALQLSRDAYSLIVSAEENNAAIARHEQAEANAAQQWLARQFES